MELQTSREEYWLAHLRYWNNLTLFPREFGLNRNQVYKPQYLFLLSKWADKESCYVSVFSEGQLETGHFDTIFMEGRDDTDSMEQILMDRDMIRGAFEKHNIGYRCFFSGRRSFHFYVDFPTIPVPNFAPMARNFVKEMDIEDLLDLPVVGNRRGMGRIPYTYNKKGEGYAVYYDGNDTTELEFISANCIIQDLPQTQLKETNVLKFLRPEDDYDTQLLQPAEVAFDGMYPDCILNIMTKLAMERHATHDERIHLAAYMFRLGHSFDEIVNAFSNATDFNQIIAEQQVRSIIGRNYKPYRCDRVKTQMRNVCPHSANKRYCHYIKKLIIATQTSKG